nr:MAG TPA: hypothetical protein [Caudoviricetes sp.]
MTERASTLTGLYQGKFEKLCQLVQALSVAARHLSQRERQGGLRVRAKNSLRLLGSLRETSLVCAARQVCVSTKNRSYFM